MSGDNKIIDYFRTLKRNKVIGVSYLFIGDNFPLVKEVIKLINCREDEVSCGSCWDCQRLEDSRHPDLLILEPEGMTLKIEAIRQAQQFLSLKSFRLMRKVLVIKQGENLSPEAANAFLKTLEEPPQNCFIAVCVSKLEGVLPTIISRCRQIYLSFDLGEELDSSLIKDISRFLKGEKVDFKNRREFSSFLWTLIIVFRDHFISLTSGPNNRLLNNRECEIILKSYSPEQAARVMEEAIKVYSVANTINLNLGLNLIKNTL